MAHGDTIAMDGTVRTAADRAIEQVRAELAKAQAKFAPFNSAHEGYAVILEEVRELEREVFWGTPERMLEEAVQVAAMGLRFLVDIEGKYWRAQVERAESSTGDAA